MGKQTENRRQDGRFATGNQLGRQFRPGQSGNPAGRPPGPLTASIRDLLHKDDGKAIKALAAVAVQRALKGDFRFYKEVLDRTDGKVTACLDVSANGTIADIYPGLSAEQLELIGQTEDGPR